jgi:hypothetical protein
MSQRAGIDLKGSFSSANPADTSNLFYMGLSESPNQAQSISATTLTVNDFCANQTFHLNSVEIPKASVQSAVTPDFDSSGCRQDIQAVRADYENTHESIINYVTEVAKQSFGAAEGNDLMGQILPSGGPTHKQAAFALADPTGTLGAVAAIAGSVQQEMSASSNPEVIAKLDEMLSNIRAASSPENNMSFDDGSAPLPPPPEGMNCDNITGTQLLEYMSTPLENHPIMQQCAEMEVALDAYDNDCAYVQENGHQVVTADKLAQEISEGDVAAITEMTGDAALAEDVVSYSSYAVEITCESMQTPGGLNFTDPAFATSHELSVALAEMNASSNPALSQEALAQRAAQAFRPEDNGVMV